MAFRHRPEQRYVRPLVAVIKDGERERAREREERERERERDVRPAALYLAGPRRTHKNHTTVTLGQLKHVKELSEKPVSTVTLGKMIFCKKIMECAPNAVSLVTQISLVRRYT